MKNRTYYYSDILNDDFAENSIESKELSDKFIYNPKNIFYKIGAFIIYDLIAKPFTLIFDKIAYHQSYVNKKVIKKAKGQPCFFYGNHTLKAGDAFIPNHFRLKKNFIIVNTDTFAIKGISTIVKMLGAIPVPNTIKSGRQYLLMMKELIKKGNSITIYPEAHIWPYYTEIRPFVEGSFAYPVDYNCPCFSFTNVYLKSKNKLRKKPIVKTYINGPFYPNNDLDRKERIVDLRNRVYESMVAESKKQEQVITNRFIFKEKTEE